MLRCTAVSGVVASLLLAAVPALAEETPAPPPLVAQAQATVDDDTVDDTDGLEPAPKKPTGVKGLTFMQRYMPVWFPKDLHPQLEKQKWWFVLGGIFLTGATVWGPFFFVKPTPELEFSEIVKHAIVRTLIQIGGHVALYAGWIVLGLLCPPIYGFYLWIIPMYLAQVAWFFFGTWQSIISYLVLWDAALKEQGTPETRPDARTAAPRSPAVQDEHAAAPSPVGAT